MSATIAARAHSNATRSAPASMSRPARGRGAWLPRMLRMMARRPGRALVMLLFSAAAAAILVNALMFQKVRHPAPIAAAPATAQPSRAVERRAEPPAPPQTLAQPQPQPQSAPAAGGAAAPHPPVRPADLPAAAREAQPRPPAGVTSVPRTAAAAPAPAAPRVAPPRDPIADLINGPDIRPPAEIRGVATAKPPQQR